MIVQKVTTLVQSLTPFRIRSVIQNIYILVHAYFCMDVLELKNEMLYDIIAWMEAKNYPYNTRRQYGYTLKWLWDKVGVLNKESLKGVMKKFKHQNQKAVLVLINNYCYEHNIDFRIILPRGVRREKKRVPQVLPRTDIELMIKAAPNPYNLVLKCIFRIGAGLRISEAIKLSWYHFKWSEWLEEHEEGKVLIKGSKGHDRLITVPKWLMEELYSFAKDEGVINEFQIPTGGIMFMFGERDWKKQLRIIDTERWKDEYIKYAYDWFRYNVLKKYCDKAIGYHVRVHQLRHSRATHLLEEGVTIEILQKLLGHQDIRTTMIYLDISDKQVFDAMKGRD